MNSGTLDGGTEGRPLNHFCQGSGCASQSLQTCLFHRAASSTGKPDLNRCPGGLKRRTFNSDIMPPSVVLWHFTSFICPRSSRDSASNLVSVIECVLRHLKTLEPS